MPPVVLFVLLALAPRADADGEHARVDIRPLAPARAVTGLDARRHVAGELLITNYHADTGPLSLVRAEVFADGATAALAALEGDDLGSRVSHPGRPGGAAGLADARVIAGGEHVLLYLWVTLPDGRATPRMLRHTLTFRAPTGRERRVVGVAVPVLADDAAAVGPPFRTGLWLAHQGPGNHRSHHWGSQLADGGRVTIPQRFAIDFIGLDAGGRAVRTEARTTANDDWVGFGADVVAVADGVVRAVRDGVADNVPLAPLPPPSSISARGLYGNYVIVESGRRFVHYAHLQRGSVRVQAGQRVRRGDPLGRVGNSGNSSGPHLHLHVSDRATFEGSDGLALAIGPLQVAGQASIEQTADLQVAAPTLSASGPWRAGVPLHGHVIRIDTADRPAGRVDRGGRGR
jgi:murein DD-endopeptidase MepM/ murein hydrolase activator NlpD